MIVESDSKDYVCVWIQIIRTHLVYVFKNWKLLFENICENMCRWKSIWKCVKCCLKTEKCYLKTQTKRALSSCVCVFWHFFFWFQPHFLTKSTVNSAPMHCSWTHKFHFSVTFSLKISHTVLFTHLKIILLQCF